MVHGFSKGFVNIFLSLTALLAGIIITAKYSSWIADAVANIFGFNRTFSGLLGIFLLFLLLFITAKLIGKLFKKISGLSFWNKFCGAILGGFEGGILLSLLLLFLSLFDIPQRGPSLQKSFMYEPVKDFAGLVYKAFITKASSEKYLDDFFGSSQKESSSNSK